MSDTHLSDKEKLRRFLVVSLGAICGLISIFVFEVDISMKILIPPLIMLAVTTLLFLLFCDMSYEVRKFNENL